MKYAKTKTKYPSLRILKARLWKLTSILVRRRGADSEGYNNCFTCGARKHWKELQAGHFKHNRLDYDFRNLKPQCVQCNKWGRGKLDVYGLRLAEQHGIAWVQKLEYDSRQQTFFTPSELTLLIDDYKKKTADLDRNPGRSIAA